MKFALAATSGPFRNVVEPWFDDVITPESFCQDGIGMESGEMPPPLSAQAVSEAQGPAALVERALKAVNNRPVFGFNFDPSHLHWQMVDPVEFIRAFPDRIFHVHVKDAARTLDGRSGILASHLNFGDPRRGWDFRSPGRGQVNFEEIAGPSTRSGTRGRCRSNGK